MKKNRAQSLIFSPPGRKNKQIKRGEKKKRWIAVFPSPFRLPRKRGRQRNAQTERMKPVGNVLWLIQQLSTFTSDRLADRRARPAHLHDFRRALKRVCRASAERAFRRRGCSALGLAGFPPHDDTASAGLPIKKASLQHCNKCSFNPD